MEISARAREALYQIMFSRRDVRGQFLPDPIDDSVITRILDAAHHAPSVGFMQPWDFILVRSKAQKRRLKEAFNRANKAGAQQFSGEQQALYRKLKLEGIEEAPLGICITCDRNRVGPVALGRTAQPEMDLYSCVCAVQNLWLAARAENLGVGWVSIIDYDALRDILGIPEAITPIAYLCLGKVDFFHDRPELEQVGWRSRLPLEQLIHEEHW